MTNPKPQKPDGLDTPGLQWRKRNYGWAAYWVARADIVARGYPTRTIRLWPYSDRPGVEPGRDDWETMASRCAVEQDRMLAWANGSGPAWDPRSVYDGTIAALVRIFLEDPDSPYRNLRFHTARRYDRMLGYIKAAVGEARVGALTFRDFKRWYERFAAPKGAGGAARKGRGQGYITFLRIILAFGALNKLPGCKDARETLSAMEFEGGKRRTEILRPEHVVAIIAKAHELGYGSIALAQALQDGCIVRQKDVVGEWVPTSEPGLSDVHAHGQKWLMGFRWEEVSPSLVLTHRLSKSVRGKKNMADAEAGKVKEFDLTLRPLVMAELAKIPPERRRGPMVVCEYTGLPWRAKVFQEKWREIATAAGVPKTVQNRDTRAGGITHGRKAGARLEDMRHGAGHSQISTTAGYDRDDLETDRKVATLRWKNESKTP